MQQPLIFFPAACFYLVLKVKTLVFCRSAFKFNTQLGQTHHNCSDLHFEKLYSILAQTFKKFWPKEGIFLIWLLPMDMSITKKFFLQQSHAPMSQPGASIGQLGAPMGKSGVPVDQTRAPIGQPRGSMGQPVTPMGQMGAPMGGSTNYPFRR